MPINEGSQQPIEAVTPLLIDVQSKLDREISLESLARQSGYSPFHFHRFFSNAVGETPKKYVDRLRLERAAYKLAITGKTVLQIALSVGFANHETFSRAFKRAFGYTPRDYRRVSKRLQAERLERNRGFKGEGCLLSDVQFVTLPAMKLLAIRRHGAYSDCPVPFLAQDRFWNDVVAWAKRNQVSYHPLTIAISYDDPTVTPRSLQRLDACVPIDCDVTSRGRIRRVDFVGGRYGGIEHVGPYSTIDQAYRNLADGIRRSSRYDFDEGPPVQIYRKIHIGGDAEANVTEVYFPIRSVA